MNMKKKIRKAFHAATPNVLGRILDDCPTAGRKTAVPASPAPEKRSMPHWTRELIATAAAFALLIAVAGGAYVYIRSLVPSTGNNNPTGISTEAPSHSDPVVSDLEPELENTVRAMVCPEGTAANYVGFGLKVSSEQLDNQFIFTAHYNGYTYEIVFDEDGQLAALTLPPCDCEKTGYISAPIAEAIVQLFLRADGDVDGNIATIRSCSLMSIDDEYHYVVRGNYNAMSSMFTHLVDAQTGKIWSPDKDTGAPMGSLEYEGVKMIMEIAYHYVGLSADQDLISNSDLTMIETEDGTVLYVVSFIHKGTLYEVGIGIYDLSVLYCNSTVVTPITESQALQIAQERLSAHLSDLWHFEVVKDIDGGYSIHYGVDSVRGTIVLDQYGYLQSILNSDDPVTEPSNAEDRIGWRVARDIALAMNGMELEEVRSLSCRFVYKASKPHYYEITIDGGIIELIEARSGWIYYEGDGDGSPKYDHIISQTEALNLVLQDIGGETAEKWLNGNYDEGQSECVLRYVGGDPGRNQTMLEYTVTVWIEDHSYVYTLDPYTGYIWTKSMGTFNEDDPEVPTTEPDAGALSYTISEYGYGCAVWPPYLEMSGRMGIIVNSVSELTTLCGGSLPDYAAVHDEAFFAEHSLIIVHYRSGGDPFAMLPGALTVNDDGSYNLELNYYAPQWQSTVIIEKHFVLEVDRPLDADAELILDITGQTVVFGNFRNLFESKSELESVSYQIIESDYRPEKSIVPYATNLRIITSLAELSELADGMIPENSGIDEEFFEDHSLIIVEYGGEWEKCSLMPGQLTQGKNGTLYLELEEYYCTGPRSTLGCELVIYAVDQVLASETEVLVLRSGHKLSADEFDKMFP